MDQIEKSAPPTRVHLINPSDSAFGTAVITPRWLYVLAAATPSYVGDPALWDETLDPIDPLAVRRGDIVGIGIHTGNALRGYHLGNQLRERGAWVIFGGIHATLYADEVIEKGGAHAVVRGDGDVIWPQVIADCLRGTPRRLYEGGRIDAQHFKVARWDLLPSDRYMWGSVQTVRGCPKHCSFCSVWRTDGQRPRQRAVAAVLEEVVALRRRGFCFIALADDNFYPVSLSDLRLAERQGNHARLAELSAIRAERFALMEELAQLPNDIKFFTQITMEAAEDPAFLEAMHRAHILGVLVGIESVTKEGLKAVYKDFNYAGDRLAEQLRKFGEHGIHVLGSFIFGLPSDRPESFQATFDMAVQAKLTFAQFVLLTPFPGTVDFERWEKELGSRPPQVAGVPITRYWLIPAEKRPKMFMPHPVMQSDEMRTLTQQVWDDFYSFRAIWKRAHAARVPNLRSRLAFLLVSKLYRQMYARTGITTDSSRRSHASHWARRIAAPCRKLFAGKPMPDLQLPESLRRIASQPEGTLPILP